MYYYVHKKKNLNEESIAIIEIGLPMPKIKKCMKTNITQMVLTINTIQYYLFADLNDASQQVNHKVIMSLCEKFDIPFKN